MLTKLRLERFKNFQDSELILGPLTLLVGTNASGKSNIRDAFRFLHGIARGYNLAEIMGEKYVEGGVLQWRGIRGGTREAAFLNSETFALEVSFYIDYDGRVREASYRIEVNPNTGSRPPRVCAEHLLVEGLESPIFESKQFLENHEDSLSVKTYGQNFLPHSLPSDRPIIAQLVSRKFPQIFPKNKFFLIQEIAQKSLDALNDMRFLDLDPDAMRLPSFPGQIILGDRGENLSSVLQRICKDPTGKHTLLQWIQELTPMDAKDFEFPVDLTGKILLTLVEESGQKTSAYSASDGTLRFLATIAALLGPEPASFYFFEELENGIHPTRLHLLLQLIERKVSNGTTQMIATTHSSQLLRLVNQQTLEYASLTYRLEGRADAQVMRILDIPDAKRVITEQSLGRLHESAWLENVMEFMEDDEEIE